MDDDVESRQLTDATPEPKQGSVENEVAVLPRPKVKVTWLVVVVALVLAGAGVGVAVAMGVFAPPPNADAPFEIAPALPKPKPSPEPPAPRQPLTVTIDGVEQLPYSEVWIPPDTGENYWQVVDPAFGYPETGGTTYVLAHACESKECTGDQLRKLEVGDTIDYLGAAYQVQESREIMKTDIALQDIWYHDPNRIVVITCILDEALEVSEMNDIVIATKV